MIEWRFMEFPARFFDGSSLSHRDVQLRIEDGFAAIRAAEGGGLLAAYRQPELIVVHAPKGGNRIDLATKINKDVRLVLEFEGAEEAVAAALPDIDHADAALTWSAGWKLTVFAVAFLSLLVLAFWQLERIAPSLIPIEKERVIGETLAQSYLQGFGAVCTAPEGAQALSDLTAKLAPDDLPGGYLTVQVVDEDIVNAFALPGGQVVLFNGLIQKARSVDEVAGVLAHEIGHVRHRHALRGIVRSVGLSALVGMISGGYVGDITQQLAVFSFSRDMEKEADAAAMDTLSNAGVSPGGLIAFFERRPDAKASENSEEADAIISAEFADIFSTHPLSAERVEIMKRYPAVVGARPALDDAQWQDLRKICSLTPDED
jgi:Zn-dependent protease with chaperone function